MRKNTRFKFNAYLSRLAELNGVDVEDLSKKFSVEPSVTQTLITTVQESSEFLSRINMVPVDEQEGEKIGLGVTGSIASTTDTDGGSERKTADFKALASRKYKCEQVNFDFHNLSIYIMDSSHRRHIEEVARRDRIENYESLKIDFVIEDYGCAAMIENIELGDFTPEKNEPASSPVTETQPETEV
ncbi:phage major capsid protein, P2 family [Rahnella aceris]|nr:P2 family phage major capsid protein [Rahnella aceris]UNK55011.1 phage major capsid protein, P2 family [Rahnella aceris]